MSTSEQAALEIVFEGDAKLVDEAIEESTQEMADSSAPESEVIDE